ncbi:putative pbsp domain-containing protein [Phaeoacremonium minimum UCRPA7]|uniref:Putative pbsp domain-containing protein n=1 Tax=Phaeoacremonium minimum (strain UCR-PA7) TaxID=1286976 RepID=R8BEG6_PHAM7|nr:putative pbsp domain-containing protein [Phaeoacremonium minimum UCRPA7]EON97687.1 putative pbsp domain-containing protein [Phaeoacremonium minimum UCRPA7]
MAIRPQTTPVPNPILIFMPGTSRAESTPPAATQTPIPLPDRTAISESERTKPRDDEPEEKFPQPKLRLEIRSLDHPGAARFLSAVNASQVLKDAVHNVQRLLYARPSEPTTHAPPTRSVTVVLRDMGGVAYTTGSELDNDHKEIHFSLGYIAGINPRDGQPGGAKRATDEITGVLTHELVHCYQYNGKGTCPGGLIEGIADWVRLNCDLSPPHWRRETSGKWDGGYQHTAYFLEYLEDRFGSGTVRRLNEKLRTQRYEEKGFWTELLGRPVEQLWGDYVEKVKEEEKGPTTKDGDKKESSTVDEGTQT